MKLWYFFINQNNTLIDLIDYFLPLKLTINSYGLDMGKLTISSLVIYKMQLTMGKIH
jgi:hypothetical protein